MENLYSLLVSYAFLLIFVSQELVEPVAIPAIEGSWIAATQGTHQVNELGEAEIAQLTFLNCVNLELPKWLSERTQVVGRSASSRMKRSTSLPKRLIMSSGFWLLEINMKNLLKNIKCCPHGEDGLFFQLVEKQ